MELFLALSAAMKQQTSSLLFTCMNTLRSTCLTHLFLCGDVEVAVREVKEEVLVDLLPEVVTRNLTVLIRCRCEMYLDK